MDPLLDPSFKMMLGTSDESEDSDDKNTDHKDSTDKRLKSRRGMSKKKKKEHHKSKDKKKHKKHRKKSSERNSSSSEESEEDAWVEKGSSTKSTLTRNEQPIIPVKSKSDKTSQSCNSNDMQLLLNVIPTYSNDSRKQKRKDQKQADRELSSIDKAGLHERELNPYWKNGGTGLPSEDTGNTDRSATNRIEDVRSSSTSQIGDGGLSWLKKSYQRAKEQAQEEGKSMEEIAAERWGSLSNFYSLLEEAETKAQALHPRRRGREVKERDHRSHNPTKNSFRMPSRDSDEDDDRKKSGHSSLSFSRHPKSSSNHQASWKKASTEPKRSVEERSRRDLTPENLKRRSRSRSPFSHSPSPPTPTSSNSEPRTNETFPSQIQEPMELTLPEAEIKVLTDIEMNTLNAKILKAELLSNMDLVGELKMKLEEATKIRTEFIKTGGVLGKEPPGSTKRVITKVISGSQQGRSKRDKLTETHKDGERVRYFPDDDKYSLSNMYQKEKMTTVEDGNALFSRLAGTKGSKTTDEYDLDDIFADKASSSKKLHKEQESDVRKVLDEEKRYKQTLDHCEWCFEGKMQKNIVIAIGEKSFICVPPFQSLTEGHCIIVPMFHTNCSTEVDEDVWAEMQKFRQAIVRMFKDLDQDVVVFENALFLKKKPHMFIECVPMPKEIGELAPIYFKKAIQESETEWSQNKKLVDLRGKDIRKGVPKGLPYFWVDFGLDSGFAHVIEDEKHFPRNFAQEIIGGMMELDHQLWRKQKRDDFNAQRNKVMEFLKIWGPYDWTRETA